MRMQLIITTGSRSLADAAEGPKDAWEKVLDGLILPDASLILVTE